MKKTKAEYLDEHGQDMGEDMEGELKIVLEKEIKESHLATTILKRADSKRYGSLQKELANSYLLGKDDYPKTVAEVLKIMNNYKDTTSEEPRENKGISPVLNVSFLQTNKYLEKYLRGTNDSFFKQVVCNKCRMKGHYQANCKVVNPSGIK